MHWVPRVLRICRRGKTCDEANRVKDKVFHLRDLSYQKFLEIFVAVLSIKSLLRRYVDRTRILFSFWNHRRCRPRRRVQTLISRTSLRTTTSTMCGDIKGEAPYALT